MGARYEMQTLVSLMEIYTYCLLEIKTMPLVYRDFFIFFFNEMTQYTSAIKNSCLNHALYQCSHLSSSQLSLKLRGCI